MNPSHLYQPVIRQSLPHLNNLGECAKALLAGEQRCEFERVILQPMTAPELLERAGFNGFEFCVKLPEPLPASAGIMGVDEALLCYEVQPVEARHLTPEELEFFLGTRSKS